MSQTKCLREQALEALILPDPCSKVTAVKRMDSAGDYFIDITADYQKMAACAQIPGRPSKPELVDPKSIDMRSVQTQERRVILLHAIAHIQFNAINLHLDIAWRFPNQSEAFYLDWINAAKEEAKHFRLLRQRLGAMGHDYGTYTAHNNGLWEMAEKTNDDLLARLALVARTLEAYALDVTTEIQNHLAQTGDNKSVAILDSILKAVMAHVEIANRWYLAECALHKVDPIEAYADLLTNYPVTTPKRPYSF